MNFPAELTLAHPKSACELPGMKMSRYRLLPPVQTNNQVFCHLILFPLSTHAIQSAMLMNQSMSAYS